MKSPSQNSLWWIWLSFSLNSVPYGILYAQLQAQLLYPEFDNQIILKMLWSYKEEMFFHCKCLNVVFFYFSLSITVTQGVHDETCESLGYKEIYDISTQVFILHFVTLVISDLFHLNHRMPVCLNLASQVFKDKLRIIHFIVYT